MAARFSRLATALACAGLLFMGLIALPAYAYASQDGHPVVVSMGDSYSSGEGTEPFYDQDRSDKYESPDWLAHRSENGWPGKLVVDGQQLKESPGWYYVAASGAVTAHILGGAYDTDSVGRFTKRWKGWDSVFPEGEGSRTLSCQSDQLRDLEKGSIDYVTLTIGGNDVGFASIVSAAALNNVLDAIPFVDTGDLDAELRKALNKFNTQTRYDLVDTYKQVQDQAGSQAHVIVADYPHLFPASGRSVEVKLQHTFSTPADWIGVSADDASAINSSVDVFDAGIRDSVAKAGGNVHFVDVRPYFNGHEEEFINPMYAYANGQDLDQTSVSSYSVHPNEAGQEAYAQAVQVQIDEIESGEVTQDVEVNSDVAMSLVFDVSGSMDNASAMSGMSKLASAKKQSSDFVRSVNGGKSADGGLSVRVGVVSFSDDAIVECGLSNDPDDVAASIDALHTKDMTNMYAGLSEGIDQLLGENGPRLMVFLSDGLSNVGGSRSEILELAGEAEAQDIAIYTIGFGPSGSLDEDLLQQIADITGGEYSHEDSASISSATVGLFATMMNARLQATSEVLHSIVGAVGQDDTADAGSFDITKNGTVQVYLYWPGSILDMLLTDPDGVQVGSGYAGVTVDTSSIPTLVTIENAKQGTWNMAVHGQEVSMAEEPFYAVAAFNEKEALEFVAGGGAANGGEGLVFIVIVVMIVCIGGVFAFTKRRSSDGV